MKKRPTKTQKRAKTYNERMELYAMFQMKEIRRIADMHEAMELRYKTMDKTISVLALFAAENIADLDSIGSDKVQMLLRAIGKLWGYSRPSKTKK